MTRTDSPRIGFVDPDDAFTRRFVQGEFFGENLARIDTYELPDTDLSRFPGIIVSSQVDQEFLYRQRDLVRGFLERGGVVAFSGHLSRQWLPGAGCVEPKTIESHGDYTVVEATPNPVFEDVAMDDLTYLRGVAGFFARGHNPPPAAATPILRLESGEPIVYVDEVSTNGTMFVHSGNDLISMSGRSSTAARVPGQLVAWMCTESDIEPGQSPGDHGLRD